MGAPIWSPKAGCRRTIPARHWPTIDRDLWRAATGAGEFFDTTTPAAAWAPATRRFVEQGYGTWLSWLWWAGQSEPDRSGATLVTRGRVRRYVGALRRQIAPSTVSHYLCGLLMMVALLRPDDDWDWLKRTTSRLRSVLDQAAFRPLNLVRSRDLLRAGVRLMIENDPDGTAPTVLQAIRFRDGLMIALLAARPIRLRNFASLRIGGTLQRAGDHWQYLFGARETKTARPFAVDVPCELSRFIERYIDRHRPLLLDIVGRGGHQPRRIPTNEMWVSVFGTAMTPHSLSMAVALRTRGLLAVRMSPHRCRHAAATSVAELMPENMAVAMSLLGHADVRSIERYYNRAGPESALRCYHHAVLANRDG